MDSRGHYNPFVLAPGAGGMEGGECGQGLMNGSAVALPSQHYPSAPPPVGRGDPRPRTGKITII